LTLCGVTPVNVMLVLSAMVIVVPLAFVSGAVLTSAAVVPADLIVSAVNARLGPVLNSVFANADPATTVSLPTALIAGAAPLWTPPANVSAPRPDTKV
jgi:hypothetical protein